MATKNGIEPMVGGVYKIDFSSNPVRIVSFDDKQVFYETWWEHLNDWGYKDMLKSRVIYYRTSTERLLREAVFLRIDKFSDAEKKVHRPDLPLSICRNKCLRWTNTTFPTLKEYEDYLVGQSVVIPDAPCLNIAEIMLAPFDSKGFSKKAVIIKAMNGGSFSCSELLWNAHNIQASHLNADAGNGVGLYRQGFEKGIPSFYIGGYYDRAGTLKALEDFNLYNN